jgi:hypothetical protein
VHVDFVSAAIVHLALRHPLLYETLNLVPPRPVTVEGLTDSLGSCGFAVRRVPVVEYAERLAAAQRLSVAALLVLWALSLPAAGPGRQAFATLECKHTLAILESAGIRCPDFDASLLGRYVDYCVDVGFLARPDA